MADKKDKKGQNKKDKKGKGADDESVDDLVDGDDADDDGGDKKGKDKKGKKKDDPADDVDPSTNGLPGYIGVGLLGGVIVGFGPLRDAAQGNGPFEEAMLRFVACVLFCLLAASLIGRLLDSVPPEEGEDGDELGPGGVDGDAGNGALGNDAIGSGGTGGIGGAGNPTTTTAPFDPDLDPTRDPALGATPGDGGIGSDGADGPLGNGAEVGST